MDSAVHSYQHDSGCFFNLSWKKLANRSEWSPVGKVVCNGAVLCLSPVTPVINW